MKNRLLAFILLIVGFSQFSFAQSGGKSTYEFLAIPSSARATALGGSYNNIYDGDAGIAIDNPAQLQPSMHKYMSLSYSPYIAKNNYANFNYVHDMKLATFQFGTIFMNYGQQEEYDEFGNRLGLFNVNDIAIYAGAGHVFKEKYSFGANAKLIYSQLESYSSLGMAFDMSAMYIDTGKLFIASLVIKNVGFQMKSYTKSNQEFLPTDVQLGFSKRFKHLPFRLNVTLHNLYRWDVVYNDPNAQAQSSSSLFGGEEEEKKGKQFTNNLFGHFIFGGEFQFGKAFLLGFGYNHQRRAETKLTSKGGLSGFSFGFGLHIKRFDIQYGMGKHALAGTANHITVNINLCEQIKTKKK